VVVIGFCGICDECGSTNPQPAHERNHHTHLKGQEMTDPVRRQAIIADLAAMGDSEFLGTVAKSRCKFNPKTIEVSTAAPTLCAFLCRAHPIGPPSVTGGPASCSQILRETGDGRAV
jgi:hypothetical protein